MSFPRNPLANLAATLSTIAGSTSLLRSHHIYNLQEHEARMDELEGTLRGHVGIIEEALDRLKNKATEAEKGKMMQACSSQDMPAILNEVPTGKNAIASEQGTKRLLCVHEGFFHYSRNARQFVICDMITIMQTSKKDIVLFHYTFSPYGKRVVWYLTLAGLAYSECHQPATLPRPDLTSLGVNYRRIPILSHGRDVYCDTRAIFAHLSNLVPNSSPLSPSPDPTVRALSTLLSKWMMDTIFGKAAQLLPLDLAPLSDPTWTKDREQLTGSPWSVEKMRQSRPDSLVHLREGFEILEDLLSDGREWMAGKGKDGPGWVDIEAIWPFHWLYEFGTKSLPEPIISSRKYPQVYAYLDRFTQALEEAKSKAPKPKVINGDKASDIILGAELTPLDSQVDPHDPLEVKEGEMVQVSPTDWGFSHKDIGILVALNKDEVVILAESKINKQIRIHYPRANFKVVGINAAKI